MQAREHQHVDPALGQLLERPDERRPHIPALGIDIVHDPPEQEATLVTAGADRAAARHELTISEAPRQT